MEQLLDLYTDYLLSSTGSTTATGLSRLLEGELSHDKISRLLSGQDFTSKDLWHQVKSLVRSHETDD
ncbi:MAG: IS701 family transposase, partial [Tannerellaceae bacterium]|nr:IS701 family transposase [Tannerellaceae bacterium]